MSTRNWNGLHITEDVNILAHRLEALPLPNAAGTGVGIMIARKQEDRHGGKPCEEPEDFLNQIVVDMIVVKQITRHDEGINTLIPSHGQDILQSSEPGFPQEFSFVSELRESGTQLPVRCVKQFHNSQDCLRPRAAGLM